MKLALPSLAASAIALSPLFGAQVDIGDRPDFQFRQEVTNGMGIQSLADLQGKPLLVDFWGTH